MENVSRYCYDNGVLINKFDIRDNQELEHIEREITTFRVANLVSAMKKCLFFEKGKETDLEKVVSYEAISKSNEPFFHNKTPFCYPSFIFEQLNHFLKDMSFRFKQVQNREDFLTLIAYYYGEMNMVHPFREGNGRTLRTFMVLLVDYLSVEFPDLNFELQYSLWNSEDREDLLKATVICNVTGNSDKIRECFDKVLVYKNKEKKSKG